MPSSRPSWSARTSRVQPGSVLGAAATSGGTGSSWRSARCCAGPASIVAPGSAAGSRRRPRAGRNTPRRRAWSRAGRPGRTRGSTGWWRTRSGTCGGLAGGAAVCSRGEAFLLIFPSGRWPRDGLGTCQGMASRAHRRRDGCRGFTGPFPLPLWMSVMKLSYYSNRCRTGAPARFRLASLHDRASAGAHRVNRGPVSFSLGDDGSLVARRGAGGLVSGLSSVSGQADVLWVCAALSDADRAAARGAPDAGGRLGCSRDGDARAGPSAAVRCSTSRRHLPARVQRGRQLHPVVRPPPAVRHAQPAELRARVPPGVGVVPRLQRGLRGRAGRGRGTAAGGGPRRRGRWSRTTTCRWSRGCSPTAAGPADRALLAHARGRRRTTTGCCPTRWAAEVLDGHARRRPCRVPLPALGRRVHGLLRGRSSAPRSTRGRAAVRLRAATSPTVGVHPLGVDAAELRRAGREPRRAGPDGRAAPRPTGGRQLIVRDRPDRAVQEHRARPGGLPRAAVAPPGVARPGDPSRLRLPVPARPAGVPRVHRAVQRLAAEIEDEFGTAAGTR